MACRFAKTQPEIYCDSLHTLHQMTSHAFFERDLKTRVLLGDAFCQDLFHSVVTANDVSEDLKLTVHGLKYVTYRADVYGVLSRGLKSVGQQLDGHRNVLFEIFKSFFSEDGQRAIHNDFEAFHSAMNSGGMTNAHLNEMGRLFASMAAFVERSIVDQWPTFKSQCRQALGVISNLAGMALQVKQVDCFESTCALCR